MNTYSCGTQAWYLMWWMESQYEAGAGSDAQPHGHYATLTHVSAIPGSLTRVSAIPGSLPHVSGWREAQETSVFLVSLLTPPQASAKMLGKCVWFRMGQIGRLQECSVVYAPCPSLAACILCVCMCVALCMRRFYV